ncbi:MAG: hypothetical protein ACE5H8_12210 [Alphaproteobacteria bacterium]
MTGSRSSTRLAGALLALLFCTTPLAAQVSGPLDIVPETPALEPLAVEPTPPAAEPAPEETKKTFEVNKVQAIDPEAVGLYEEAEGGFGFDMWRGSSRPLIERLLPHLPAGVSSRAIDRLDRRLLLSTAAPPEGPRGTSLLALRIERLAAMGAGVETNHLLRAAPPGLHHEALARARLDALLLTADYVGACAEARDLVRRDHVPYWDKVLIFCQALAGQHDAAALGVALLRESGNEPEPAFLALLRAMAGESDVDLSDLRRPTALHLAMLNAAHAPVPAVAVAAADPAIARAIAFSANTPLDLRLRAAERAEALGALPVETLAEVYASVPFTSEELANPLSRAADDTGPFGRALLYQALARQVVPAARAEVLRAFWKSGRASGGWGGFATAARITLEALSTLTPSPELVWIADDAARALLAAGRFAAARAWFDLAEAQAGASAEAAAAAAALWPLVMLVDDTGALPWDSARLAAWRKTQAGLSPVDRRLNEALLFALFDALGEPAPIEAQLPLLDGPLRRWSQTLVPVLWRQLRTAAAAGRVGETVLLALIALDPGVPEPPGPLALAGAISALRRVGLGTEARALALETALARGL